MPVNPSRRFLQIPRHGFILAVVMSLLVLIHQPLQAQQLVLVQGYLNKPSSWSDAGITQVLMQNGWDYGGEFFHGSDGVRFLTPPQTASSGKRFYQVSLPTEAPLRVQAFYLTAYLKKLINENPGEEISLVGHSAGGRVARYSMVSNPDLGISRLITIASPHLGTDSAALGRMLGDTPLTLLAPLVGANTLNRSQGLNSELLPEAPGRFLFWLNRQVHPPAEYISIVRDQDSSHGGDWVVPQQSQYLEHVYALRNRAFSYVVPASHNLTRPDGWLILDLLEARFLRPL